MWNLRTRSQCVPFLLKIQAVLVDNGEEHLIRCRNVVWLKTCFDENTKYQHKQTN